VGESAETSDVVVEGNVDFNGSGNKILNVLELLELVLALDVFAVGDHHTGHETTKGSDTVTLTDTKDRGIDVSGTSLQGAVSVSDGTPGVIVEVSFNVTANNTSQHTDEFVNLTRRSAADSVGDTNTVNADLVDSGINGQQVNEVRTEGVLAGEPDLNALGLDEFDDFNGGVLDIGHVLAVGVLPEIGGGSDNDVTG
jgi:hypothetical protein